MLKSFGKRKEAAKIVKEVEADQSKCTIYKGEDGYFAEVWSAWQINGNQFFYKWIGDSLPDLPDYELVKEITTNCKDMKY